MLSPCRKIMEERYGNPRHPGISAGRSVYVHDAAHVASEWGNEAGGGHARRPAVDFLVRGQSNLLSTKTVGQQVELRLTDVNRLTLSEWTSRILDLSIGHASMSCCQAGPKMFTPELTTGGVGNGESN
jgi:hypothetical protein